MALAHERLGNGPPLVLLHATACRRQDWEPVAPLLAPARELILVDLPGHGESAELPAGEPASAARLAVAVGELLDELEIDRAHIAGNSLGGQVAFELARAGRALSVTGLSPSGFSSDREGAWTRAYCVRSARDARRLAPVLPALARTGAGRSVLVRSSINRGWRLRPQELVDKVTAVGRAQPTVRRLAALDGALSERFEPGFDAGGVPVTVGWAQADFVLPRTRNVPRVKRMFPGARVETLCGCGHVPMWDDPSQVARLIVEGSRP